MPLLVLAIALAVAPIAGFTLNLHNGYIRIFNDSNVEVTVYIHRMFLGGQNREFTKIVVPAHGTRDANECCFSAGTEYRLNPWWWDDHIQDGFQVRKGDGEMSPLVVTPRLCNERGIPHGYAYVKTYLVGNLKRVMHVARLDEACPV